MGGQEANAGWDGTVRMSEAAIGAPLTTLEGHATRVLGVAFSPDGRRVASVAEDGRVPVWDVDGGVLDGHIARVFGAVFLPTGRRLASAGADGTGRVWDAGIGVPGAHMRTTQVGRWGLVFSSDDRRLASARWDRTMRMWEAAAVSRRPHCRATRQGRRCGVLAYYGRRLAGSGDDGSLVLWGALIAAPLAQLRVGVTARDLVWGLCGTAVATDAGVVALASSTVPARAEPPSRHSPPPDGTRHAPGPLVEVPIAVGDRHWGPIPYMSATIVW